MVCWVEVFVVADLLKTLGLEESGNRNPMLKNKRHFSIKDRSARQCIYIPQTMLAFGGSYLFFIVIPLDFMIARFGLLA